MRNVISIGNHWIYGTPSFVILSLMQKQYSYRILLDPEKDAWNWYEGCNRISYGIDWKERVPQGVYEHIHGVSESEAYEFIDKFLAQKYDDDKDQIEDYRQYLTKEYDDKFVAACEKMVEITGKPLYRNDFTVYLTTFPRAPYNYHDGSFLMMIGWVTGIKNFMHELLHFQTIYYWVNQAPKSEMAKLDDFSFNWLKESLTVVLDESVVPLINKADAGYPIHAEFRAALHEYWKTTKDFNKLIEFGLAKLPDYIVKPS